MKSSGIVINRMKAATKEDEKERERGEGASDLQKYDLLCRTSPDFRGQ